jgi:hypothetical protein
MVMRHPIRGLLIGPLHRLGWLRAATVIVAGAKQGALFRVHMPLPAGWVARPGQQH